MFAGVAFAQQVTPEDRQKIESALPAKAPARAMKPRKLLVMSLNIQNGKPRQGHASIPAANLALELMGKKTGAYEVTINNDINALKPESLKQFDAICFNNTVGVLTEDPELRKSLVDFVRGGKGFAAFHAGGGATFVQYPNYGQFPEFGEMVGGYEDGGHPWGPRETITIRVEDPRNPINAAFKGQDFAIQDEVFQFRHGYSREKVRVLLSIDTARTDMDPKRRFLPERAADKDFALEWIKQYGKGRVFQTSLGHNPHIFWNPTLLQHFLAGIQFVLGDLEVDASPSAKPAAKK
jgi:hypothetical protein